ncbi:hypothetical protein FB451DRAFT_1560639 [Mycena latifolia]|nr:hypothetical protein FB451DRAFT_1560639 [Mycena latifolia]
MDPPLEGRLREHGINWWASGRIIQHAYDAPDAPPAFLPQASSYASAEAKRCVSRRTAFSAGQHGRRHARRTRTTHPATALAVAVGFPHGQEQERDAARLLTTARTPTGNAVTVREALIPQPAAELPVLVAIDTNPDSSAHANACECECALSARMLGDLCMRAGRFEASVGAPDMGHALHTTPSPYTFHLRLRIEQRRRKGTTLFATGTTDGCPSSIPAATRLVPGTHLHLVRAAQMLSNAHFTRCIAAVSSASARLLSSSSRDRDRPHQQLGIAAAHADRSASHKELRHRIGPARASARGAPSSIVDALEHCAFWRCAYLARSCRHKDDDGPRERMRCITACRTQHTLATRRTPTARAYSSPPSHLALLPLNPDLPHPHPRPTCASALRISALRAILTYFTGTSQQRADSAFFAAVAANNVGMLHAQRRPRIRGPLCACGLRCCKLARCARQPTRKLLGVCARRPPLFQVSISRADSIGPARRTPKRDGRVCTSVSRQARQCACERRPQVRGVRSALWSLQRAAVCAELGFRACSAERVCLRQREGARELSGGGGGDWGRGCAQADEGSGGAGRERRGCLREGVGGTENRSGRESTGESTLWEWPRLDSSGEGAGLCDGRVCTQAVRNTARYAPRGDAAHVHGDAHRPMCGLRCPCALLHAKDA